MRISRRSVGLAGALFAVVMFASCSGDAADRIAPGGGQDDGDAVEQIDSDGRVALTDESQMEFGAAAQSGEGGRGEVLGAPDDPALSPAGPKVIKTAHLRVEVERGSFGESLQLAMQAAETAGGYVLTTETEGGRSRSGSITIRVPSERFEGTLAELKGLGEVTGERVSGEDVSEEFIDLEARLRNLEAQERVLLRLMDRAESVAATIRVQRELSRTQLEIERLNGRLRFLEDQTSFSTITARILEEGVAPPRAGGVLARAWEQAKSTALAVVSGVIIGAGFLLPILVLVALGWVLWRVVGPRFRKAPAT